jgi:glycosyltransferase involved in cell wall biosynthesis
MKEISVFLPAYNEELNIRRTVSEIDSFLSRLFKRYEILVVNDGSEDKTGKIAEDMARENTHIRVIHHKKKRGYGFALKTGFENSKHDFMFYTDMDGQFDINELKKFLPHINDYDLVIGFRTDRKDPVMRIVVSKGFNFFVKKILNLKVKDPDCAFKLCKKELLEKIELKCERSADVELLLKSKKNGAKIKEIGIRHYPRRFGKSEASVGPLYIVKPSLVLKSIKEILRLRKNVGRLD